MQRLTTCAPGRQLLPVAGSWKLTGCSKCLLTHSTWQIHWQPSEIILRQLCQQQHRPDPNSKTSSARLSCAAGSKQEQTPCKANTTSAVVVHVSYNPQRLLQEPCMAVLAVQCIIWQATLVAELSCRNVAQLVVTPRHTHLQQH